MAAAEQTRCAAFLAFDECKQYNIWNFLSGRCSHAYCALQAAAEMVGKRIAELCLSNNIEKVCFDRGGNIYHGRVKVQALLLLKCLLNLPFQSYAA